jgi:hypothetical protein
MGDTNSRARPSDQALPASPPEPASGLSPSGNDPSRGEEAPDFYEYLARFTAMGKAVHIAAEKVRAMRPEALLRQAIEDALKVIAAEAEDLRWSTHWRCGLGRAHRIMSEALASGIEARSDETLQAAQPVGQEPVLSGDAQTTNPPTKGR